MGFLLVFLSLTPFRWWIGINQELSRDMGRSTGLPDVILSATSTPLKFLQHSMYHLGPPQKIGALLLGFSHLRNTPVSSCCWKKNMKFSWCIPWLLGHHQHFPAIFWSLPLYCQQKNPWELSFETGLLINHGNLHIHTNMHIHMYIYIWLYSYIYILYLCLLCSCFPY